MWRMGGRPIAREKKDRQLLVQMITMLYLYLFRFGMEIVVKFWIVSHKTIVDKDQWN